MKTFGPSRKVDPRDALEEVYRTAGAVDWLHQKGAMPRPGLNRQRALRSPLRILLTNGPKAPIEATRIDQWLDFEPEALREWLAPGVTNAGVAARSACSPAGAVDRPAP